MQRSNLTKQRSRGNCKCGLGATDDNGTGRTLRLDVPYAAHSQNRDRLLNVIRDLNGVKLVNSAVDGSGQPPAILIRSHKGSAESTLQTIAQSARDRVQAAGQGWTIGEVVQDTSEQSQNGTPRQSGVSGTMVVGGLALALGIGALLS